MKSKTVTFLLCAFLGIFGVHRFYTQKVGTGLLMLVTGGGLMVWWLIDLIRIATDRFRDKAGDELRGGPPDPDQPHAGFGVRLAAAIVDSMILSLVALVLFVPPVVLGVMSVATGGLDMAGEMPPPADPVGTIAGLLYLLIIVVYYVALHASRHQATVGKRCFDVRLALAGGDGRVGVLRSLWRYIGYFISALPLGLGYLLAAFHPRKRALHDLLAGTVVVYTDAVEDQEAVTVPATPAEPATASAPAAGGGAGPIIIIALGLLIVVASLALSFL